MTSTYKSAVLEINRFNTAEISYVGNRMRARCKYSKSIDGIT